VAPLLPELAVVHDEDAVRIADGGQAMGDDERGAPRRSFSSPSWIIISVSVSTLEVASSRTRIAGS